MPEPRFPIRLVALDVDGTLLGPDHAIGPRTVAAVRAAADRGVVVALVTGRMAAYARGVARTLGITAPLIAHHGAAIHLLDAAGGSDRVVRHLALAGPVARDALDWAAAHDLQTHMNRLDELLMDAGDPRATDYGRLLGVEPVLVSDLRLAVQPPVTKVMAGGRPGPPAALFDEARAVFAGRACITLSNPRFLDILAPEVSKGHAVHWLARRFDVPLGQALAIGDNLTDLDMLAEVGHPVAMPHAPEAVRAQARTIAPSLDEDGAAQVIEELVLGMAPARRAGSR